MSKAFSRRLFHRIPMFLLAVVCLLSCQNETSTRSDQGGAFQVQQQWSVEPERYPDSVAWIHKESRGAFLIERMSATAFQVTATFPRSIALDSLEVELWRLGMRTTVVQVKVTAKGELEVNKEVRSVDEQAMMLLRGFDSARSLSDTYGNASDPAGLQIAALQRYLASRILAGTISVKSLPHGVDSSAVIAQVLVQGSSDRISVVRIAAVAQVEVAQLRILAEEMLRTGRLSGSDSLALFPPDPIRVAKALAIDASLEAGGATIPVRGSFAWNKGLKVGNPQYQVRGPLGRSEDFLFQVQQLPGNTDTSWSLDGNFSIQAKASAAAGTDTLFVTLQDDSGRSVTAFVPFTVLARDTTTPVVKLVGPSKDTSVPNGTREIEVVATATDPAGISSITVGSQSCTSSPCRVSVTLAVGENIVLVDAWDKAGNHLPSPLRLTVTRANDPGDTIPPRILRTSPTEQRIAVDYSTKTLSLAYKVTDDSLDLVSLNGRILTVTSGVFQATVDLEVGADTLVLQALDKRGNPARDTTFVTRNPDTTEPVLELVTPKADTQVAFATSTLRVLVSASDPAGIDTVWVGGVRSESSASPYAAIVSLVPGRNTLVIEVVDSYGNRSDKELVIVRAAAFDSIAPRIEKVGPRADTSVASTTSSLKLSWKVTDDSTLSQVVLNGTKLIVGTDGLYSATQSLTVGPNVFVLEAKDARGNTRLDTLKVARLADATGPKVVYKGGSKDTAVWAYVPSVVVSWGVTDDALKSVSINGAMTSGVSGVFSTTVSLATDTTMVRLIASDETGNIATDSVRVVRKYDKIAPTVAFQKQKYRLVANAVAADTLVWKVSDNLKLKSVTVNGTVVPASNGSFTHIVASLPVGTHRYILIASDSAGNVSKDTATVARTALAPTHSAAAGNYIGTVYDTLKSEGADSILYSTDGANWKKFSTVVSVTTSGTLYVKALPGDVISPRTFTISHVKSVAFGGDEFIGQAFAFYLLTDGSVYASGSNQGGAFGLSSEVTRFVSRPIKIAAGVEWIEGSREGSTQVSFIKSFDQGLFGAGNNGSCLGIGSTASIAPLSRVRLDNVISVATNANYSLFLTSNGSVWYAGSSDSLPVQIPGLSRIASVSIGSIAWEVVATALDSSGNVWKWSVTEEYDQELLQARVVMGPPEILETDAADVSIGTGHMLVLKKNGTVLAMGGNANGQLGQGNITEWPYLTAVPGLNNVSAIAAGAGYSLFLGSDGILHHAGMIMTYSPPPTGVVHTRPTQIANDVAAIWEGANVFAFRKKDGTIWGAGWNGSGQLGIGEESGISIPTRIDF